ncbi:MAG: hypothetical protein ACF8CQ_14125, partial [Rhodopirellula sp. JB044]
MKFHAAFRRRVSQPLRCRSRLPAVVRSITAGLCVMTVVIPGVTCVERDAAICHAEDPQAAESENVSIEQIERWVKQLSSDSYLRRKRATADLTRAGQVAVRPLVGELETGDLETTERVITILQEIASTASIVPP